ncbi:hypothetical protein [Saccharibacillus endophyticus]|uniref:Uncharacterized protein n=1 Tax=Saccharibacillus endophyticus TaxID=2060666 RepID=A0ABQ1ZL10_9BACL|nr:hypothetical protein [Saccharibacillus endophyticus]GGH67934.1 hypothetical protein GCM10007362_01430 [Saccharibacillus endophyticus]
MDFESAHRFFLDDHLAERSGERRDRLERGHREAEQLFVVTSGGRYGKTSTICIRSMKSRIGED